MFEYNYADPSKNRGVQLKLSLTDAENELIEAETSALALASRQDFVKFCVAEYFRSPAALKKHEKVQVTQKGSGRKATVSAKDDRMLRNLVKSVKDRKNPGFKRSQLLELIPGDHDPKVLSRLLEKGKRRGVLRVEGKGRAAQWYATELLKDYMKKS